MLKLLDNYLGIVFGLYLIIKLTLEFVNMFSLNIKVSPLCLE